jgi:hypothetical protein
MSGKKTKPVGVEPTREDIDRFSHLDTESKRVAAATAWAGMRAFQIEMGPGHAALDLITAELPEAYRRNWAKGLLGAGVTAGPIRRGVGSC